MNDDQMSTDELIAKAISNHNELVRERNALRVALLHVIEGVGGAEAIGWNPECPTCVLARDLVSKI